MQQHNSISSCFPSQSHMSPSSPDTVSDASSASVARLTGTNCIVCPLLRLTTNSRHLFLMLPESKCNVISFPLLFLLLLLLLLSYVMPPCNCAVVRVGMYSPVSNKAKQHFRLFVPSRSVFFKVSILRVLSL